MPLGAFRLNSLARFVAQASTGVSSWSSFTESNITNKYFLSSNWHIGNIVPMDDTYGIINYCEGSNVNLLRSLPYERVGSTLSFGNETTRTLERGTDRTYPGVKMGNYSVVISKYCLKAIVAQWNGGLSYTWGTVQNFTFNDGGLDRMSAYAVTDDCLLAEGVGRVKLFSRSGTNLTLKLEYNFSILNGTYTQIVPLETQYQYALMVTNTTNSQVVLFTVDPTNFTITENDTSSLLSDPFISKTNSNFRMGQTITTEDKGNVGILAFSKYTANYPYIDLLPFSVDNNQLTIHTTNAFQITDTTSGTDRPWSIDLLKLNAEWYLVHGAFFEDTGTEPGTNRSYHLLKYNRSNNTITEEYNWRVNEPTGSGIVSIRQWVSQINSDYLIFMVNEDTDNSTVRVYVAPRT